MQAMNKNLRTSQTASGIGLHIKNQVTNHRNAESNPLDSKRRRVERMSARPSPTIPSLVISPESSAETSTQAQTARRRGRSSSLVSLQEVPADPQETLDQGALNNYNADWVNFKGNS